MSLPATPTSNPSGAGPRCPVCSARFRGSATCSRCGTDLSLPMRIAARALAIRRAAREALLAGDLARALRLSAAARRLHHDGP